MLSGCSSSERVIVVKSVLLHGDYKETDRSDMLRLCVANYRNSISQEAFEQQHGHKPVRLTSGAPIVYSVQAEYDDRRLVEESYVLAKPRLTWKNGVAMNDGESEYVEQRRLVHKGRIRSVRGDCSAFEYHF